MNPEVIKAIAQFASNVVIGAVMVIVAKEYFRKH